MWVGMDTVSATAGLNLHPRTVPLGRPGAPPCSRAPGPPAPLSRSPPFAPSPRRTCGNPKVLELYNYAEQPGLHGFLPPDGAGAGTQTGRQSTLLLPEWSQVLGTAAARCCVVGIFCFFLLLCGAPPPSRAHPVSHSCLLLSRAGSRGGRWRSWAGLDGAAQCASSIAFLCDFVNLFQVLVTLYLQVCPFNVAMI